MGEKAKWWEEKGFFFWSSFVEQWFHKQNEGNPCAIWFVFEAICWSKASWLCHMPLMGSFGNHVTNKVSCSGGDSSFLWGCLAVNFRILPFLLNSALHRSLAIQLCNLELLPNSRGERRKEEWMGDRAHGDLVELMKNGESEGIIWSGRRCVQKRSGLISLARQNFH